VAVNHQETQLHQTKMWYTGTEKIKDFGGFRRKAAACWRGQEGAGREVYGTRGFVPAFFDELAAASAMMCHTCHMSDFYDL